MGRHNDSLGPRAPPSIQRRTVSICAGVKGSENHGMRLRIVHGQPRVEEAAGSVAWYHGSSRNAAAQHFLPGIQTQLALGRVPLWQRTQASTSIGRTSRTKSTEVPACGAAAPRAAARAPKSSRAIISRHATTARLVSGQDFTWCFFESCAFLVFVYIFNHQDVKTRRIVMVRSRLARTAAASCPRGSLPHRFRRSLVRGGPR